MGCQICRSLECRFSVAGPSRTRGAGFACCQRRAPACSSSSEDGAILKGLSGLFETCSLLPEIKQTGTLTHWEGEERGNTGSVSYYSSFITLVLKEIDVSQTGWRSVKTCWCRLYQQEEQPPRLWSSFSYVLHWTAIKTPRVEHANRMSHQINHLPTIKDYTPMAWEALEQFLQEDGVMWKSAKITLDESCFTFSS